MWSSAPGKGSIQFTALDRQRNTPPALLTSLHKNKTSYVKARPKELVTEQTEFVKEATLPKFFRKYCSMED